MVLITLILLSFSQLFIQSSKTAVINNEKIVTINLADAILAKVQAKSYTKLPTGAAVQDYFKDSTKTNKKLMDPPQEIDLNGKTYSISYQASQETDKSKLKYANFSESELDLVKVVITVTSPNGKTKGSSEGYVSIE